MAKYMIVYKGEATDMSEMDPEAAEAVMGKWAVWMEGVGAAMVDMGQPFGPSASVVDDGSQRAADPASGYSVLEADSLDAAKALTSGHPYLSDATGAFAIDIYEMMPAPGM
jgi:hypothetical protein